MSITRGVLAQSPEPEAHDKVLDNNPDRIGIWKCWFLRTGENRSTRRKTSRSKDENQQQTQPTSDTESRESNPGRIGGRPAWETNAQPLRHPCSPKHVLTSRSLRRLVTFTYKLKRYLLVAKPSCNGPFAASGHMVHTGGQAAHWDIQNKATSSR